MKTKLVAAAIAAVCVIPHAAFAQEAAAPAGWFSHEGAVELTWDHVNRENVDTIAAKVEYGLAARLSDRITAQAAITLEPVAEIDGESAFQGEGAFVEGITLQYAGDAFTVYGGKFNPVFSSAAELAPGLYGAEIGETYETTEKLGIGGDVNLGILPEAVGGEHVLSAAVFTADRTILSGSVGTEREQLELADGGPGNTESLESYAVSLDGALPNGLGYTLGYRSLAASLPGDVEETGVVAGLNFTGGLGDDMEFDLLAEGLALDNADGVDAAKRTFYTFAGTLRRGDWHGSVIASGSDDNDVAGGADLNQVELSIGRDFESGMTLDGGVKFVDEDGATSTVIGLRLTFGFS